MLSGQLAGCQRSMAHAAQMYSISVNKAWSMRSSRLCCEEWQWGILDWRVLSLEGAEQYPHS